MAVTAVRRWQRKPGPEDLSACVTARYEPGLPLDALRSVAGLTDPHAEIAEVTFPSGKILLAFTWTEITDSGESHERGDFVRPGKYLAHGTSYGHLYVTDDENLNQFYVPAWEVP
jgi:hypothetical protein